MNTTPNKNVCFRQSKERRRKYELLKEKFAGLPDELDKDAIDVMLNLLMYGGNNG